MFEHKGEPYHDVVLMQRCFGPPPSPGVGELGSGVQIAKSKDPESDAIARLVLGAEPIPIDPDLPGRSPYPPAADWEQLIKALRAAHGDQDVSISAAWRLRGARGYRVGGQGERDYGLEGRPRLLGWYGDSSDKLITAMNDGFGSSHFEGDRGRILLRTSKWSAHTSKHGGSHLILLVSFDPGEMKVCEGTDCEHTHGYAEDTIKCLGPSGDLHHYAIRDPSRLVPMYMVEVWYRTPPVPAQLLPDPTPTPAPAPSRTPSPAPTPPDSPASSSHLPLPERKLRIKEPTARCWKISAALCVALTVWLSILLATHARRGSCGETGLCLRVNGDEGGNCRVIVTAPWDLAVDPGFFSCKMEPFTAELQGKACPPRGEFLCSFDVEGGEMQLQTKETTSGWVIALTIAYLFLQLGCIVLVLAWCIVYHSQT